MSGIRDRSLKGIPALTSSLALGISVISIILTTSSIYGPRQANLVLIAYASSEGSGEPAHPRSLARTSTARSYKQWVKRNLQTESQIPGLSEWLGMRSENLSWRNARRHKFAWRGSYNLCFNTVILLWFVCVLWWYTELYVDEKIMIRNR